ncbi:hypothetical protein StoSoilB3_42640 (plasmid) [Arthrobacter sp. StoSoilB3]|nr:hypothetical protein StoSoilB3_42640 [Arthrobacter sp. StoSoilB3]
MLAMGLPTGPRLEGVVRLESVCNDYWAGEQFNPSRQKVPELDPTPDPCGLRTGGVKRLTENRHA